MDKTIAHLKKIVQKDCGLLEVVALDALNEEDPLAYLQDVSRHGCISGSVPGLIYYADTHCFFDHHYEEIEELRQEYEADLGVPIHVQSDLKNFFAWFAYEETVHRILSEIE